MSRTYRRTKSRRRTYWWEYRIDEKLVHVEGTYFYIWVPIDKKSAEYKKNLAKFHSDAGTYKCKEPGPGWFRNLYVARPLRRQAKNELRKFMKNGDYEPLILSDPPLPYWT